MSHTPVTTGVTLDGELGGADLPNLLVRPVSEEEPLVALPAMPPLLESAAREEPVRKGRDTSRGYRGAGDAPPSGLQQRPPSGAQQRPADVDTLRGVPALPVEPPVRLVEAPPPLAIVPPPASVPLVEERAAPPRREVHAPSEETIRLPDGEAEVDTLVTRPRWTRTVRVLVLLAVPVLAIAALLVVTSSHQPVVERDEPPAPPPPAPTPPVVVPPAGLVARGPVEPRMRAAVRSRLGGEIAEVRVAEGQVVHSGEVLVRLAVTDYQRELSMAHQQVAAARSRLDEATGRSTSLGAAASEGSQEDAARARQALKNALAAERGAEQRLADTTIIAPFDGQVIARDARPGELVAPGTQGRSLVTLADLSEGYVRLALSPADAAKVRVGQRARVTTRGRRDLAGSVAVVGSPTPGGEVPVRVSLGRVAADELGTAADVTVEIEETNTPR